MDSLSVAIENAVAVGANAVAFALGSVLLFYVLIAFVYGRLIRKYRLSVVFLGLVLTTALFLIAEQSVDPNREHALVASLLSCFIGLELSDLILKKFARPRAAV